MAIDFNWFDQKGFTGILSMIENILNLMRIIVPIALILMTTVDIFKKVIDPNEKEGQERIVRRVIAALIVFLLPTVINLLFNNLGLRVDQINTNTNSDQEESNELVICPDDREFHVGDYIFIKANFPNNYNGRIEWRNSSTEQNVFQINIVDNGHAVNLKVLNKPKTSYGYLFLFLDNESTFCKIRIL